MTELLNYDDPELYLSHTIDCWMRRILQEEALRKAERKSRATQTNPFTRINDFQGMGCALR